MNYKILKKNFKEKILKLVNYRKIFNLKNNKIKVFKEKVKTTSYQRKNMIIC